MKQTLLRCLCAAVALALGLATAGCTMVDISTGMTRDQVVGSGPLVTAKYTGGEYSVVDVRANLEVIYTSEYSDTVTVELQENLLDHLQVSVSGGRLTVQSTMDFRYSNNKVGKLYVSTPTLERMYLSGATILRQADPIVGDEFFLDASGAAEIQLEVDVEKLSVGVGGAGMLTLSGRADRADLWITGAGSMDAGELQTREAVVAISGAGSGDISCSEHLAANISGAGSLTYRGDPEVEKNIFGAGSVTKC